jgi:hypothetical protein
MADDPGRDSEDACRGVHDVDDELDDADRRSDDADRGVDDVERRSDDLDRGVEDADRGMDDSNSASGSTAEASPSATGDPADQSDPARGGRPEVVVPMDLYKTVTVFSTLIAITLVVGGMIALDAATARATAEPEEIELPVAFLGVAAIVLGAGTYAFAARFRAEGMGNPKDADDEG